MNLTVLEHAAVGAPITRAGVSFFPVVLHQPAGAPIATGATSGVVITERPHAEVPTLSATATGPTPALLVEGETLIGGAQHRTLNVSVLVPAGATVEVPVSCVEVGRWGGDNTLQSAKSFASRRIRRSKHQSTFRNLSENKGRHADQHEVWNAVASELDRLDTHNESGTLVGADDVLELDDRLSNATADLVRRGPLPGQCGVVIAHGRRIVASEIFAGPDLLSAHWEPLVRSALLDAPMNPLGRPSATSALRLLRQIASADSVGNDAVGLGDEHHVRTNTVVAQALTWHHRLIHASAFVPAH